MPRPQFLLQWQPWPLTVEVLSVWPLPQPEALPVAPVLAALLLALVTLLYLLSVVALSPPALGQHCQWHWQLPSSAKGEGLLALAPTVVQSMLLISASD
jgi:hypothetical protein